MAIDKRKQDKIRNVAKYYLSYNIYDKFIRFDALCITEDNIDWIKNAF